MEKIKAEETVEVVATEAVSEEKPARSKRRGRKQKIQRSILQSVVFQWYKIQYFFFACIHMLLLYFVVSLSIQFKYLL